MFTQASRFLRHVRLGVALPVLLGLLLPMFTWLPPRPAAAQIPHGPSGQVETNKPVYGGVYRRPLDNDPSTLDPAYVVDVYSVVPVQQIFDGLVQYDEAATIRPALAESWQASRDGLTWTFQLRKGVRFHHGREFSSDDVVFSFARLLNPAKRSPGAGLLGKIRGARAYSQGITKDLEGVRALDRHSVQIVLEEPWAAFISALASMSCKIVPQDEVLRLGDRFGLSPLGTGPFRFVSWQRNKRITLEANPDYFGGPPFLKGVELKIFPGLLVEMMYEAFRKRELEDSRVPTHARTQVIRDGTVRYVNRPILGIRYLGMTISTPPFDKLKVRQALLSAIDRERIVRDVWQGGFKPAVGILPPGTLAFNPDFRGVLYDPKRAKTLLAEAGFPGGRGLPVVQLWSSLTFTEFVKENEAILHDLAVIGVRAHICVNTDWPSFEQSRRRRSLPMFRYAWYADVPDPDNFLTLLFHSQSPENVTGYHNAQVDSLLSQAQRELDPSRRVQLYRQAERLILEDAAIIPLSYATYERVFQPYVSTVHVTALGDPYIRMNKIWLSKHP